MWFRGRQVGPVVEIAMSRDRRHGRQLGSDKFTTLALLAVRRFPDGDVSAYETYASNLEDAARYAARGELGYSVNTVAEGGAVRVSLVARLLRDDGRVETEISHEQRFEDPDSHVVLVQADEKATELRALAQELNDQWTARRTADLLSLRAEYDKDDAQAQGANELDRIVDAEAD